MPNNNQIYPKGYNPNAPVVLTQAEVAASEANKQKRKPTFRQLPVVRDASNLQYVVAQIEMTCPRKMRCMCDEMERLTTTMLQMLDLANLNMQERAALCNEAHSCVMALMIKIETIQRLCGIHKDQQRLTKKLCESVIRQITAWRNSSNGQGAAIK